MQRRHPAATLVWPVPPKSNAGGAVFASTTPRPKAAARLQMYTLAYVEAASPLPGGTLSVDGQVRPSRWLPGCSATRAGLMLSAARTHVVDPFVLRPLSSRHHRAVRLRSLSSSRPSL